MDKESQRPNPIEDYMKKIVDEDNKPSSDTVDLPPPKTKGPTKSPIADKAFEQRKHIFDPTGHLEELAEYEVKVADIRRHPFGLVVMYTQFIVAGILSMGLVIVLLPSVLGNSVATRMIIGVILLLLTVSGTVFLALATRIYQGNQMIITDLNITEVQQIGLFNRRVSELSMANVEDVSADSHGFFPTMFNYGLLTIETAGEAHHFEFRYCPYPNAYAKAIQDARSEYLRKYGGRSH